MLTSQIRTRQRGLYFVGVGILFVVMLLPGALLKLLPPGILPVDVRSAFTGLLQLPLWMVTFTGIVEGLAGLLLLIPRLRFWGAALIVGVMVGAIFFQLRVALFQWTLIVDCSLLAMSALVAWFSRPDALLALLGGDVAGGDGGRLPLQETSGA